MLYVENKKSNDSGRIFPWEYFLFLFSRLKYIPPFCLFGFFLHFIGLEKSKSLEAPSLYTTEKVTNTRSGCFVKSKS